MLRSWRRNIAKNLLADMGYDKINRKLGRVKDRGKAVSPRVERKLKKTAQGRARLARMYGDNPKLWQRVTTGDLAKDALKSMRKKAYDRGLKTAMYGRNGVVPD